MRMLLFLCLLTMSGLAFAGLEMPLTVKDRLRIILWAEGLKDHQASPKKEGRPKLKLPEELERPLRNF